MRTRKSRTSLPMALLLVVSLIFHLSHGFLLPSHHTHQYSPSSLASTADDFFMASLRNRIEQVNCSTSQRLPIIVSDTSLLPRQASRAVFEGSNSKFLSVLRERIAQGEPYFGIVGTLQQRNNATSALAVGTKAEITKMSIVNDTKVLVDFRGTDSCFRVVRVQQPEDGDFTVGRWFRSAVDYESIPPFYIDEDTEESYSGDAVELKMNPRRLRRATRKLTRSIAMLDYLVMFWINCMYNTRRSQIIQRLESIGPVPSTPNERLMWIGALFYGFTPFGGWRKMDEDSPPLETKLLLADDTRERVDLLFQHFPTIIPGTPWHVLLRSLRGSSSINDERFYKDGILPHHFESGATFLPSKRSLRTFLRRRCFSRGGLARGTVVSTLFVSKLVPRRMAVLAGLLLLLRKSDFFPFMGSPLERNKWMQASIQNNSKNNNNLKLEGTKLQSSSSSNNEIEVLGEFE